MKEDKKQTSLLVCSIILIIIVGIIATIIFIIFKKENNTEKTAPSDANITNRMEKDNSEVESDVNSEDYFILYQGYEIKKELGTQFLDDMDYTDKNLEKYNINYYTYKNSKYIGQQQGKLERTFGEGEGRSRNCYRSRKNSNF